MATDKAIMEVMDQFKKDHPRHVPGRVYKSSRMPAFMKWLKKQTKDKDLAMGVWGDLFKGADYDEFDKMWAKKATVRLAFEDALKDESEKTAFEEVYDRVKIADNVGRTILEQMGGARRLQLMIGAQIDLIPRGVRIMWPNKQRSRGNMVEIILQPSDTYDMNFYNVSARGRKPVKKYNDVYADQLVELFEGQTGWYLRMASSQDPMAKAEYNAGHKRSGVTKALEEFDEIMLSSSDGKWDAAEGAARDLVDAARGLVRAVNIVNRVRDRRSGF